MRRGHEIAVLRHGSQNTGVSLERASWLTVVIACAVAVVLLALADYTGYSIVVAAVGLAAAVNL